VFDVKSDVMITGGGDDDDDGLLAGAGEEDEAAEPAGGGGVGRKKLPMVTVEARSKRQSDSALEGDGRRSGAKRSSRARRERAPAGMSGEHRMGAPSAERCAKPGGRGQQGMPEGNLDPLGTDLCDCYKSCERELVSSLRPTREVVARR
jgi:hypothetical protein